jgi:hypothetical protein
MVHTFPLSFILIQLVSLVWSVPVVGSMPIFSHVLQSNLSYAMV